MAPVIERLTEGATLGEGPHWDVKTQSLYFVDILGKTLNRYDPTTKRHTKVSIAPDQASFIIPVKGEKDRFVTGFGNSIAIVTWDGESDKISNVEKLDTLDSPPLFNDGKVDSTGRLWAGTMTLDHDLFENTKAVGTFYSFESNRKLRAHLNDIKIDISGTMTLDHDLFENTKAVGTFYSFESNRKLRAHLNDIRISNGIDWNDQIGKMYYIDSLKYAVNQYDFDLETGTMSNEQVLFDLKRNNIPGCPDGMAIDTDGNLWVAVFDGNRVIQIDGQEPDILLRTVKLPARQITSVTFGGRNLDELYVTSGSVANRSVKPVLPIDGAVYRVTGLGVKGPPPNEFVLPPQ